MKLHQGCNHRLTVYGNDLLLYVFTLFIEYTIQLSLPLHVHFPLLGWSRIVTVYEESEHWVEVMGLLIVPPFYLKIEGKNPEW